VSNVRILAAVSLLAAGCHSGGSQNGGGEKSKPGLAVVPGAPASSVAVPADPAKVAKVVNPKNQPPYSGPTGTLKGTVRMEGDPSPDSSITFPPGRCGEAAATYGKVFRVGQDKGLADAMVTVTGYPAYVPAREEAKKLTIHGCAPSRRTAVLAFGQRLEVSNLDPVETYMPYLDGAAFKAVMVAIPNGDPVKLYPLEAHRYTLRDMLPKPFFTADVYVLGYATHDVTGLDGAYEIPGIPVGPVKVDAFLPALGKVKEQRFEIKAGDNTLDITMTFDKTKDIPKPGPVAPAVAVPPPPASAP
jgi:hypothetical protein